MTSISTTTKGAFRRRRDKQIPIGQGSSISGGASSIVTNSSDLSRYLTAEEAALKYVDLTSNQIIAGVKTFSSKSLFSSGADVTGTLKVNTIEDLSGGVTMINNPASINGTLKVNTIEDLSGGVTMINNPASINGTLKVNTIEDLSGDVTLINNPASINGTLIVNGDVDIDGINLSKSTDRSSLLQLSDGSTNYNGIQAKVDTQLWSFMGSSTNAGIYDDTGDKWGVLTRAGGGTALFHNGNEKLATTPAGVGVIGEADISGNVFVGNYIGSDNYVSESLGWRVTYAGEADFRKIFTDELIAKTFIADVDLALLSGHTVSKSVTQVSRDFQVPATSATGVLWVEALPGQESGDVFATSDWVRMQVIDRTGGGLIWAEIWVTITSQASKDIVNGEQSYNVTCQDDGGVSGGYVRAGAAAQDWGQTGDGLLQQYAAGTNAPYFQVQTWQTDPSVSSNRTVHQRMGNLTGITGQSGFGLVTRRDTDNYVTKWYNTDSDWGIRGVVGGAEYFRLGDTNKIASWNFDTEAIYTGTKKTTDGFTTGGITLASNGSLRAESFYLNDDGDVAFKNINEATFKVDGDDYGIKISGGHIWENDKYTDDGYVLINYKGYAGGTSKYRYTVVGDGKGGQKWYVNPDPAAAGYGINHLLLTKFEKPIQINDGIENDAHFKDDVEIDGDLQVDGTTTLNGDTIINDTLKTTGGRVIDVTSLSNNYSIIPDDVHFVRASYSSTGGFIKLPSSTTGRVTGRQYIIHRSSYLVGLDITLQGNGKSIAPSSGGLTSSYNLAPGRTVTVTYDGYTWILQN